MSILDSRINRRYLKTTPNPGDRVQFASKGLACTGRAVTVHEISPAYHGCTITDAPESYQITWVETEPFYHQCTWGGDCFAPIK